MKNCLIVDDSRVIRKVSRHIVESFEFEVTEAENGQDALAKCEEGMPDLILLDWNMPVMDGPSFVKAYRKMGRTTPIVMVTTEAEKTRVMEALKLGVNNYVVKPFTPEFLAEKINQTAKLVAKAAAAAA